MDIRTVIEEIALEGLDGITLEMLWLRLMDRHKAVYKDLKDPVKSYIWRLLIEVRELEFYILPEPRQHQVIFRYSDWIDEKLAMCRLPAEYPPDCYSHTVICQDGICGCCDDFETRQNVTSEIRGSDGKCLLSLKEVQEKWSNRFVIVASQKQRNLVLFNSTSNALSSFMEAYCLIERIARGRDDGELLMCKTRGLCRDGKTSGIVYIRTKPLLKFGLISKQPFRMSTPSSVSLQVTRLFHLKRFYQISKASMNFLLHNISLYLQSQPNQRALYFEFLNYMNARAKHLFHASKINLGHYIKTNTIPYRKFKPDAPEAEWRAKNLFERKVKVIELIKPFNIYDKHCVEDLAEGDDDDDDDDESDREETTLGEIEEDGDDVEEEDSEEKEGEKDDAKKEEGKEVKPKKPVFVRSLYKHRSVLSQIVYTVHQAGERGYTRNELSASTGIALRLLDKYMPYLTNTLKAVDAVKSSIGRVTTKRYVSPEIAKQLKKTDPVCASKSVKSPYDLEISESDLKDIELNTDETTDEEQVESLESTIETRNLSWTVEKCEDIKKSKTSAGEDSARKTLRKFVIVNLLLRKKVFRAGNMLYRDVIQFEKNRGLKELMCRKSFKKILEELFKSGVFYNVKVFYKSSPQKALLTMLVSSSVPEDDPIIKKAIVYNSIYNLKRKGDVTDSPKDESMPYKKAKLEKKKDEKKDEKEEDKEEKLTPGKKCGSQKKGMVSVMDILDKDRRKATKAPLQKTTPIDSRSLRELRVLYNHLPKFSRARALHRYLFYLLYEYQGNKETEQVQEIQQGTSTCELKVYLDVDDWRRFLPPLKKHNYQLYSLNEMPGFCMLGDIILNMPVNLFCNFIYFKCKITGLGEQLADPVKKLCPLHFLEPELLKGLMAKRTFLSKLISPIQTLAQMGLLSFGPKSSQRELEYITFYLHRKAMLLNTSSSLPGNIMTHCPDGTQFPEMHYVFDSMASVDKYWMDLKTQSDESRIGLKSVEDEKGDFGTVSILDVFKPRLISEIQEDEWLPGDHRGIAGLDSSLFVHRLSSWEPLSKALRRPTFKRKTETVVSKPPEVKKINNGKLTALNKRSKLQQRLHTGAGPKSFVVRQLNLKKQLKRHRPKKPRKSSLDAQDRLAKSRMKRMRSNFTPVENGMLLLCYVASTLLKQGSNLCVSFNVVRDLMTMMLPEQSKDKTRNAYKGRCTRLLHNEKFKSTLAHYVAMARNDDELMAKYQNIQVADTREFEDEFKQLVVDLNKKFRSSSSNSEAYLPSTLSELAENFTVCNVMDIFTSPKALKHDVKTEDDVFCVVAYEVLQNLLHYMDDIPTFHTYSILSSFSEEVISKVITDLRRYGIMTNLKRMEKERMESRKFRPLLNHDKIAKRHNFILRGNAPPHLFNNVKKHMDCLLEARRLAHSETSGADTTDSSKQTSHLKGNESQKSGSEKKGQSSEEGQKNAKGQKSENVKKLHNSEKGKGVATPTEQRSMKIQVSQKGQQSRLEKDPEPMEVQPGDDKTGEEEEPMEVDQSIVQAVEESETAKDDSVVSETYPGYITLNAEKYQAASSLALIALFDNLKMDIQVPDEMVTLNEKQRQLLHSRRDDAVARLHVVLKGRRTKADRAAEEEGEMVKDGQELTEGQEMGEGQEMTRGPSAGDEGETCLKYGDANLRIRLYKVEGTQVLGGYAVWLACSSLLTIARTSCIENLDLAVNRRLRMAQEFIVRFPTLRFKLKDACQIQGQDKEQTAICETATSSSSTDLPSTSSETTGDEDQTSVHYQRMYGDPEKAADMIRWMERRYPVNVDKVDISTEVLNSLATPEARDLAKRILDIVEESGSLGITEENLEIELGVPLFSLRRLIHDLAVSGALLKAGGVCRRFVSRAHMRSWLLLSRPYSVVKKGEPCDPITPETKGVYLVQPRIWKVIDGTLYKPVVELVFRRILTYLMIHPGSTVRAICDFFNPDLLPVAVLDVLDILEELKCVKILQFAKVERSSLFSSPEPAKTQDGVHWLKDSDAAVEVLMDAPLRLGYFIEAVKQHQPSQQGLVEEQQS